MKNSFFLFYLISTLTYCQKEDNIWYFGSKAGIDLNSGIPIALDDGELDTLEGCATISDIDGNLLFYTDGVKVWNRNHVVMPNGSGLLGHESSTQSAIIIPVPNSVLKYYIFTVDYQANSNGFRYSIVDMELDGGFGDITNVKNVILKTVVTEKLTAVKKPNGIDYWVLVHGVGSRKFFTYSITSAGISDPVISEAGTLIPFEGQNWKTTGNVKFSPQGNKILSANAYQDVQLFDFDLQSGIVSNAKTLCSYTSQYGVEFSPSGNLAYATVMQDDILKLSNLILHLIIFPQQKHLLQILKI